MRRRSFAAVGGAALAVIAVVTVAALSFPAAPALRATSKPVELPHELEQVVFFACLPGLYPASHQAGASAMPSGGTDLGRSGVVAEQGFVFSSDGSDGALSVRIEAVGDWSVSVSSAGASMQSERSSDDPQRITAISDAVTPTARSLYECMAPYRFAAQADPRRRSGAQLVELYRYDAAVLWPCLRSQGIDVGDPPSRKQFAGVDSSVATDPLSAIRVTRKTLPLLAPALRACPLQPAYLG